MKTLGEWRYTAPHINFSTRQSFMPWPLYPWYPLERRLCGSQSWWQGQKIPAPVANWITVVQPEV